MPSVRYPFPCGQFPAAVAVAVPPKPPVGVERQVPAAHRAVAVGRVDAAQLSECGDEVAVAQRDAQPPRPGGAPPPAANDRAPPVGGGGQVTPPGGDGGGHWSSQSMSSSSGSSSVSSARISRRVWWVR